MENLSSIIRQVERYIKNTHWNGNWQEYEAISKKLAILKKYNNGQRPKTPAEKQEVLSLTCYGNIGYCCSLEKGCIWRNSVLAIYGIKPSDYKRKKEEFGDKLLDGDE